MDNTETTHVPPNVMANILAAILTIASVAVACIAWRQVNIGDIGQMSPYELFPLFGLLAFSLLWCLYTTDADANYLEVENESLRPYYRITGYVLLVMLLIHPLLLITQLWRDGFGLPPGSYEAYVGSSLVWVALLGTASLFIFLAYELRRWFKKRTWWKWIVYANDLAMFAILYHGLTLGGELQGGWFRYVWFFYGSMFIIYMLYLRLYRGILHKA